MEQCLRSEHESYMIVCQIMYLFTYLFASLYLCIKETSST